MDASEFAQRVAEHIDHHHPRLGARLMKLRWAGLRTVEHGRWWWAATMGSGAVAAAVARGVRLRERVGLAVVATTATAAAIWRWDAARWRRTHVVLRTDLPPDLLDTAVDSLREDGLEVERWDGPRAVDGAVRGLVCRSRDLRRVHARVEELERHGSQAVSGVSPPAPSSRSTSPPS